ncbi:unnamed protein product [Prunus armeniaca]
MHVRILNTRAAETSLTHLECRSRPMAHPAKDAQVINISHVEKYLNTCVVVIHIELGKSIAVGYIKEQDLEGELFNKWYQSQVKGSTMSKGKMNADLVPALKPFDGKDDLTDWQRMMKNGETTLEDSRLAEGSNFPYWSTGPAGPTTSDIKSESSYGFNKACSTSPVSLVSIEQSDLSQLNNWTAIASPNRGIIDLEHPGLRFSIREFLHDLRGTKNDIFEMGID